MLSVNNLRQTVHTHRASVHQAAKLVAALLRVVGVTAGLAESNGSLQPGLWLTSPAGWLLRTRISSGTPRSVIEYGLPFTFYHHSHQWCSQRGPEFPLKCHIITQLCPQPMVPELGLLVNQTTATGIMYTKFGKVWICRFWDMQVYRNTHVNRNMSHSSWRSYNTKGWSALSFYLVA